VLLDVMPIPVGMMSVDEKDWRRDFSDFQSFEGRRRAESFPKSRDHLPEPAGPSVKPVSHRTICIYIPKPIE
jgi:hypothetical protein